jgi:hypothetical protein
MERKWRRTNDIGGGSMPVKTMPLSTKGLEGEPCETFFTKTMSGRSPPGKYYVFGRDYIARDTPAGTLVLFHHEGLIVAHARLRHDWRHENDDPAGKPGARAVYFFEEVSVLQRPMKHGDLPAGWQEEWSRGRFDQSPRTLDDTYEDQFLAKAR